MASFRRACLRLALVGCCLLIPLLAQQQPPAQPPKPPNPFETVPQAPVPQAPKPEAPKPEAPKAEPAKSQPGTQPNAPGAKPTADRPPNETIEQINFQGARRRPPDSLRAMVFTKRGDMYDEATLNRDLMLLWNTGSYDDITIQKEAGETGWIITFRLVERPVIRTIKYDGLKSVTQSEILDRLKERRVGLTPETQY